MPKQDTYNRLMFFCLLATVVITPLIFTPGFFELHLIAKRAFFNLMVAWMFGFWLMKIICEGELNLARTKIDILIVFFILFTLLSAFKAINIYLFLENFLDLILCIIFYYLIVNIITADRLKTVLLLASLTGSVVAAIGIIQYFFSDNFNLQETVTSTFGHSNLLAQYLIAIIPFSLIILQKGEKSLLKLIGGTGTLLMFFCLLMSFCRGAWLGFLTSLFFYILFFLRNKGTKNILFKEKYFFLILFLMMTISITFLSSKNFIVKSVYFVDKEFYNSINKEDNKFLRSKVKTGILRKEIWKSTLKMIKENYILGVGDGNYPVLIPKYRTEKELDFSKEVVWWAHNDYLQIFSEIGFLGASAFLILIIIFFANSGKTIFYSKEEETIYLIGLFSSVSATLIHSFFSFNLYQTVPRFFFWLSLGAILGSINTSKVKLKLPWKNKIRKDLESDKGYSFFIKGLMIIILTVFSIWTIKPILAEFYYARGAEDSLAGEWKESIGFFRKAVDILPYNHKYRYSLGLSLFRMNNFKEAIAQGEEALKLTPYVPDVFLLLIYAHNELGNYYTEVKSFDLAIQEYEKAIYLINGILKIPVGKENNNLLQECLAISYYNKGNIFFKKKLFGFAISAYNSCLKIAPSYKPAMERLKMIKKGG